MTPSPSKLDAGVPAPADNLLVDARTGTSTRWADLPSLALVPPAAIVVDHSFDALCAVRSHADSLAEMIIVASMRMDHALHAELRGAGFAIMDGGQTELPTVPRDAVAGRIWLLTSGSTGRPKRISHTLASLTTVSGSQPRRRWLCPYSPGTYAWWQLVTLSLMAAGQDLVVVDPADLGSWVDAAIEHGVTGASGTPTFWRQTIMSQGRELGRVQLDQVTLGGEPVDQAILDLLRSTFPTARVSWIYASSEVGASIVVHDGIAGFPVEWLDREVQGRPRISVEDGELIIASPFHGQELSGPVRTGDAVAIEGNRVLITGRIDRDEINVGGSKVSAGAVRDVLLSHPDVAWANVRGRDAPLVGRVVVADVVLRAGTDSDEASRSIIRWCRRRLPEYGVPRRIGVLTEIPERATLKSDV